MLIRNLTNELVNGSVGIIEKFEKDPKSEVEYPIISVLSRNKTMRQIKIDPVEWETRTPEGTLIASRKQLPLILAWSITIHKSQGKSISRLFVDMDGVFEKGQAYVALSRCTDPSGLQVSNFNRNYVMVDDPCVNFYCRNRALENISDVSPRRVARRVSRPVRKSGHATQVAKDNEPKWGTNNPDTLMMLGQLSIQESPQETSQDLS
jgi:hypothetical protein